MEKTEQEMRDFIEDAAQGLEMLARSYREVLTTGNPGLIKYAYQIALDSERFFDLQAEGMDPRGFSCERDTSLVTKQSAKGEAG